MTSLIQAKQLSGVVQVAANPAVSTTIQAGAIVKITAADGSILAFQALSTFVWSELITHVYGTTPTLVPTGKNLIPYGAAVAPTSFSALSLFSAYYVDSINVQTSIDYDWQFEAAFMPAVVNTDEFYWDAINGNDANTGKSWAQAKLTWGSVRTLINATGRICRLYIKGTDGCIDHTSGISNSGTLTVPCVIIGVPNASGKYPMVGWTYAAADVSWSANATYPEVFETATGTMTQPDRVFDLINTEVIVDSLGRNITIPSICTAQTSLANVAANPNSYWFDSGGSKFYLHTATGEAPTLGTDYAINRSTTGIIFTTGTTLRGPQYVQNLIVLGGITSAPWNVNTYYVNIVSVGSYDNGLSLEGCPVGFFYKCVTIRPKSDGLNHHNVGLNITAISQANPCVVTVSGGVLPAVGDQIIIAPTTYGASIGMNELIGTTLTVANPSGASFELSGVNSTGYTAYSGSGAAKVRLPTVNTYEIDCTTIQSGSAAGSHQSTTGHENVEIVSVRGLYQTAWRDAVTDTGTVKRRMIASRIIGTQITSSSGPNPKRFFLATDAAIMALDRVCWGGYIEQSAPIMIGTVANPIRVLNTEVPYGALNSNVTATW
jgi:hypothetical protein